MPVFGDRRTMGCTRADLARWLREMHGEGIPEFQAGRIDLTMVGVPVAVTVRDASPRSLGLVNFRELDVCFEYAPEDRDAAQRWIAAFDRHTQRGGG